MYGSQSSWPKAMKALDHRALVVGSPPVSTRTEGHPIKGGLDGGVPNSVFNKKFRAYS